MLGLLLKKPEPVSFNWPYGFDENAMMIAVNNFKPRVIIGQKSMHFLKVGDILMRTSPVIEWAVIKEILHDGSYRFHGYDVPIEAMVLMFHTEEKFIVYGGYKNV